MANKLFVNKEPNEYNGKTYFSYCIRGMIRGREVKRHASEKRF